MLPENKKKHVFLSAVLAVLLLLGLALGGAALFAGRTLDKIERIDKEQESWIAVVDEDFETDGAEDGVIREDTIAAEEVEWEKPETAARERKTKTILLIGQDRRPGETRARSDSMILCSISEDSKSITLCSLMRDMYVPFPGDYSDNRINAAYAFGGMSLLDRLIEEDFGIAVDGNVEVDFDGFVAVMDLIAPLEIELNAVEAGYLNRWGKWQLREGVNAMTGEQLLAYARTRHVGHADWERTDRQRRVLSAAYEKIRNMKLSELSTLAEAALPCVSTDMSNRELMDLIFTVAINRMQLGETWRFPAEGTYSNEIIRGMMVLVPDLKENSRLLQEAIYND